MSKEKTDVRAVLASNIVELRKTAGLTQAEFAEQLNYSDKAVSKWERGESVPDIVVLKEIAQKFGVTVDYLLEEEHNKQKELTGSVIQRRNRRLISFGSVVSVWLLASILFTVFDWFVPDMPWIWQVFIIAMPVSALLMLIFHCIWGDKRYIWIWVSALMWSIVLSVFLEFISALPWKLFIVGALAQIVILIFSGIRKRKK